ncbi:MAG: dihydrodipicolinate reductase [Bryobacteraceae bacterium]|nr:dihydrodipicolinate reductase [Bryobacteraceae bacterium]
MNLAIVGYGKMGRLLHELAPEYDIQVKLTLDEANNRNGEGITPEAFAEVDVAIEFSTPEAVVTNVVKLAGTGVGIVVGTTGWTEHLPRVRSAVEAGNAGLVWSPNFSIGVNVFFRLVSQAAQLLADEPQYGSWAWEIHHDSKKDAPSGTLLKLLDEMKSAGYSRPISASSNRAGRHPGTHEIGFDSSADTITLRHSARSREGFARGALKAAQFIHGKCGVFEFSEVLFGGGQ